MCTCLALQVASVLQLVVQHSDLHHPPVICTLLQLSQGVRAALQQSVGNLYIHAGCLRSMQQLAEFAAWLPRHAGLVSVLNFTLTGQGTPDEVVALQLMLSSLQLCHSCGCQDRNRCGQAPVALQLQEYVSCDLRNAAALHALAASPRLRKVSLWGLKSPEVTQVWCEALARLTTLQELALNTAEVVPDGLYSSLGQLQQLSQLQLLVCMTSLQQLQGLPSSLQDFELVLRQALQEPAPLQLAHLTQLQSVCFGEWDAGLPAGSVLPSSLTALSIIGPVRVVPGVEHLQHLVLDDGTHAFEFLAALPGIRSLQSLQLGLQGATADQVEALIGAVAATTQLTRLALFPQFHMFDLNVPAADNGMQALGGLQLHEHLQKLPQLQDLALYALDIQSSDAMRLTCLTGLTSLKLSNCFDVGDLAAVA